jgi:hypothetical protein
MMIKEQDDHWQIVSCRSSRREHPINSLAWTKPKGLVNVTASASLICYMEAREFIHNLEAYLAHHHGSWVYKYFAAEDVELAQTCYWHEESQSMIFNKEKRWDNLMNWDMEFLLEWGFQSVISILLFSD